MKLKIVTAILMLIAITGITMDLSASETKEQTLDQWLVLGPAEIPALSKEVLGDNKSILNFKHLNMTDLRPAVGRKVPWTRARVLHWSKMTHTEFKAYETGALYLATYLRPTRWMETRLNIHNTNLGVTVYLNGKIAKAKLKKKKITADLTLTNEKHLLVLKVLLIKGEAFKFNASLANKKAYANEKIAVSLEPIHTIQADQILNVKSVSRLNVSPDGKLVAVSLRQTLKTGKSNSWLEILRTSNGSLIYSSKGIGRISGFRWMGNSSNFSYTLSKKDKTSVFKFNLNTHTQTYVLTNIKNFSSYWWAPDMSYMVYSTYEQDENDGDYKYVKEISDRSVNPATHYSMTIFFPDGGASHTISNEDSDFASAFISPNSKFILFTSSRPDSDRPYTNNGYHLFTVADYSVKELFTSNWVNSGQWSPDSKKLLFLAGATAFDGIGNMLDKSVIPNDFDSQAFIYNIATKDVEAISKKFNPSIVNASWSASPQNIYFRATDKSDRAVFKYSLKKKTYRRLNSGVDIVSRTGFASKRNLMVYWGCSATVPHKLYKMNLSSGKGVLLKDYNKDMFKEVKIGTMKPWNYRTEEGKTIVGRLHYPVGFDKTKKYPCIVYYYGGTSPVTKDFGGRYPKNWYAANGYIVYVLQPSGAIGFGQEFSAVHVNDWGVVTAKEVIGAVKELVKVHPYVNAKRIGAMGASYGGFLTMYIATQTDTIAAYISHAGISALSSYWGIGDWGYSYSGVATAKSFPWNRKDIYVGHSPLFMADRINSPMLLLHGDVDNNVPPGESYQMFAALKLLKKEVALVTFKDQRHWILQYKKRLHWMRTIIAWWDKHLKKEPQHWKKLYE